MYNLDEKARKEHLAYHFDSVNQLKHPEQYMKAATQIQAIYEFIDYQERNSCAAYLSAMPGAKPNETQYTLAITRGDIEYVELFHAMPSFYLGNYGDKLCVLERTNPKVKII